MHDLVTTIQDLAFYTRDLASTMGSSGTITAMCSLAAGLAAIALAAGVSRLQKKTLPEHFPGDAEARQSKYALAFNQLEEARQGHPEGLTEIISSMKGQPAAALCLQAFEEFSQSLEDEKQSGKAKPKAEPKKEAKQETPKLGGSMKARPSIGGPGPGPDPDPDKAKKPGNNNKSRGIR